MKGWLTDEVRQSVSLLLVSGLTLALPLGVVLLVARAIG
jgi:hypothetical protein